MTVGLTLQTSGTVGSHGSEVGTRALVTPAAGSRGSPEELSGGDTGAGMWPTS